jgi:phosphatidylglycerophosphatase A
MSITDPARLLATAGGLGLLRPAPGTWGTAGAVAPVAAWVALTGIWPTLALALGTVAAVAVAAWAVPRTCRMTGLADPPEVVIDEVAGTWLALALVPPAVAAADPWAACVLAAGLFRLLDITKPWPLARLEHLPGWIGVMADDLAAGACAGLATAGLLG